MYNQIPYLQDVPTVRDKEDQERQLCGQTFLFRALMNMLKTAALMWSQGIITGGDTMLTQASLNSYLTPPQRTQSQKLRWVMPCHEGGHWHTQNIQHCLHMHPVPLLHLEAPVLHHSYSIPAFWHSTHGQLNTNCKLAEHRVVVKEEIISEDIKLSFKGWFGLGNMHLRKELQGRAHFMIGKRWAKYQPYLITTKWAKLILLQLGTPFQEHSPSLGGSKSSKDPTVQS